MRFCYLFILSVPRQDWDGGEFVPTYKTHYRKYSHTKIIYRRMQRFAISILNRQWNFSKIQSHDLYSCRISRSSIQAKTHVKTVINFKRRITERAFKVKTFDKNMPVGKWRIKGNHNFRHAEESTYLAFYKRQLWTDNCNCNRIIYDYVLYLDMELRFLFIFASLLPKAYNVVCVKRYDMCIRN